ncbi:hypothetical protein EMIHUDRAFT_222165 [Emiliania huxleyi CCMP1516]|uniref:Uncharacterized protein n=2 Tax=Emiliania huxleyi TaxID=2903 RepID=A0A0D3KYI9_EMIH1|nr:hypothetical protein EMIHUDRAFT_222165 [Emiliania huxleyi CCMP1516]EOD40824.1 hypothetical protein EMIHUDRAFT_222165 [Emiliania huxleyi CCMP1516]|eukprot:XP_005793253.1 hypothetical protein EMIHUDRAFT_222165 [Emiliania huxleyi CCMP1516]
MRYSSSKRAKERSRLAVDAAESLVQRYRRQSSRRHCGRFLVELQLQSDELLELLVAPPPPSPTELLNLSQCGVGRLECYLLAIALSRGLMTGVQVLWLQDNQAAHAASRSALPREAAVTQE